MPWSDDPGLSDPPEVFLYALSLDCIAGNAEDDLLPSHAFRTQSVRDPPEDDALPLVVYEVGNGSSVLPESITTPVPLDGGHLSTVRERNLTVAPAYESTARLHFEHRLTAQPNRHDVGRVLSRRCWVVLRNRKTEDVLVAIGEFDFIKVEESANALGVLATGVSEMSPIGSKVLHDPELLRLFT